MIHGGIPDGENQPSDSSLEWGITTVDVAPDSNQADWG